jgi:hypothetical protein
MQSQLRTQQVQVLQFQLGKAMLVFNNAQTLLKALLILQH